MPYEYSGIDLSAGDPEERYELLEMVGRGQALALGSLSPGWGVQIWQVKILVDPPPRGGSQGYLAEYLFSKTGEAPRNLPKCPGFLAFFGTKSAKKARDFFFD